MRGLTRGFIQPFPRAAELRNPWPRLAGKIPSLTRDLEDELRFGHTVSQVGDVFRLGGSIKGGSSSVWITVSRDIYESYLRWKAIEGIGENADPETFYRLKHLLSASGINVRSQPEEYIPRHGGAYRLLERIFLMLPPEHLIRLPLEEIVLGGWGPDAAKASAYKDGRIFLYDFVLGGAARTFIGITLHEIGHAFFAGLRPEEKERIVEAHGVITAGRALLGTEFLLDAESRIVYQQFLVDEFAAETYMTYTAQGARLREHIRGLPPEVRSAWETVYGVYLESFGGWAFV